MKLKVYLLAVVAVVLAAGCVDENYDLTKVKFDDVEIGSDDAVFSMPLATITITGDDLAGTSVAASAGSSGVMPTRSGDSEYGFTEILELINAFLPSGEAVDIDVLIGEDDDAKDAKIEELVYSLIEELQGNEQKVAALADVIYSYRDDVDFSSFTGEDGALNLKEDFDLNDVVLAINDVLFAEDDYEVNIKNFADAVTALINDEVVSQLKEYATMEVEQSVESVDIPTDIIDILGGDEEEVSIIATYTHNFPFSFNIDAIVFKGNDGNTMKLTLTPEGEEPEIRTYLLSEITSIFGDGATLGSEIILNTYTSIAMDDYAIVIKIAIQKSGSLTFQSI